MRINPADGMRKLLWLVPLIFVGVLIGIFLTLEPWLEKQLHTEIQKNCDKCNFRSNGLGVSLSGIKIEEIDFLAGAKDGQQVEFKAASVSVKLRWTSLLRGPLIVKAIVVKEPKVIYFDRDQDPAKSKSKTSNGEPKLPFRLGGLFLRQGHFTYVRELKGTVAELKIRDIDAEVHWEDPARVTAKAKGQIGTSGEVELSVSGLLGEPPLVMDTDIRVRNQNLSDLSQFFEPNAGVALKGVLTGGHAVTKLKGRNLKASVWVEFKDFDLKVSPRPDRSETVAFFTNLGAAIAMQTKNTGDPTEEKMNSVELERGEESIVGFILRGIKEAAIPITL